MSEVSIIGLGLAKNVFQAHGAGADGSVVFRRKLLRAQLLKFLGDHPTGRPEYGRQPLHRGYRHLLAMINKS